MVFIGQMKNNYHFEHADIKKIVDRESSNSAACFATAATTLIVGFVTYNFSSSLNFEYLLHLPYVSSEKKWR